MVTESPRAQHSQLKSTNTLESNSYGSPVKTSSPSGVRKVFPWSSGAEKFVGPPQRHAAPSHGAPTMTRGQGVISRTLRQPGPYSQTRSASFMDSNVRLLLKSRWVEGHGVLFATHSFVCCHYRQPRHLAQAHPHCWDKQSVEHLAHGRRFGLRERPNQGALTRVHAGRHHHGTLSSGHFYPQGLSVV